MEQMNEDLIYEQAACECCNRIVGRDELIRFDLDIWICEECFNEETDSKWK